MTTLSKDEVVKMAREAGAIIDPRWGIASNIGTATFERFAPLCRAPLVAEVERLKKDLSTVDVILEECKMDWSGDVTQIKAEHAHELLALQADRDDWKARAEAAEAELARVRAGEPFGWYSAKEDDFMLDKIRKTHERLNSHTHRIGKYDLALYTAPPQPAAQEQTSAVPVVRQMVEALERKLPGGKQTDDFESSRIGDYNQGWNDYRKAVKKMFKNINMNSSENSNPDAYLYSLEYGEKVVDTKVSIHQLNYPFGVAGADYLVRNDDGVSYVRQTKLYAALSRALAAGQKFIKENGK